MSTRRTGHTVLSPVTEQPVAEVAATSEAETDAAIERAQAAFPAWRALAPGERARLLRAFAAAVDPYPQTLTTLGWIVLAAGLLLALAELWVARRGRVRAARADGSPVVGRSHTAADVTSR